MYNWDEELTLTLTREDIALTMQSLRDNLVYRRDLDSRRFREYLKILKKIKSQVLLLQKKGKKYDC